MYRRRCSRSICSHDVAVGLQDRRPSRVDVCHQLSAILVSLIGMIALGELKIGQIKLPSLQRRDVNAKPFIEGQRIRQMHTGSAVSNFTSGLGSRFKVTRWGALPRSHGPIAPPSATSTPWLSRLVFCQGDRYRVMAGTAELNLHADQTGSGLIAEFDALVFQFICF